MENPTNTANKQKAIETSDHTQALQVATGTSLTTTRGGSVPTPPPPGAVGPVTYPPRRSTSSDTSTDELSPAMLGAIQRIISAAIRDQIITLAPPRTATPLDAGVPKEEAEEGTPVPAPPVAGRQGAPPSFHRRFPLSGSRASNIFKRAYKMLGIGSREPQKMSYKASPLPK
ncbi:UNVERIFIED_CONTAM: hypothetical protein Slati_3708500 [Sesamum latifolium]|uniref:Uncharacterized protein n=1 Tax=Sesamum latifolium TaxID=2727402 RepID=A0AAW2U315_9LAMI